MITTKYTNDIRHKMMIPTKCAVYRLFTKCLFQNFQNITKISCLITRSNSLFVIGLEEDIYAQNLGEANAPQKFCWGGPRISFAPQ